MQKYGVSMNRRTKVLYPGIVALTLALGGGLPAAFAGTKGESKAQSKDADTSISAEIVDMKGDLSFSPDYEQLNKGKLQIAATVFSADDFRKSDFVSWDRDAYHETMTADDLMVLVKTAIVFPNVTPNYFRDTNIVANEYLSKALPDNKISEISPRTFSVRGEKNYFFLYSITSVLNFYFYNFVEGVGANLARKGARDLAQAYNCSDLPENMFSVVSRAEDINFGSRGARTTNFYYQINGSDTLHISHKLVTIKKEKKYVEFPWRTLGIWDKVVKKLREETITSTMQSLQSIRKFISG
jgi:hypothetical protein